MAEQLNQEIIVASKNPVKIQAAQEGFQRMFPDITFTVRGLSVPSGVPDQPLTDEETLQGALNRARHACDAEPGANYWIGLEGGVHTTPGDEVQSFAWIVVLGHNGKMLGKARTATFFLPQETVRLLRSGLELGDADNQLHNKTNSKQQTGTVGILTGDLITRQSYYTEAVVLALIAFRNTELTFSQTLAV